MEAPFIYKGNDPLEVSAETIFDLVKSVIESGQETEFLRICKEQNVTLSASPAAVNLVKTYLFSQGFHKTSALADEIVRSARCDPPRS